MAFRFRQTDFTILRWLADYRILTIPQLAAILGKDKQAMSRRIKDLCSEGLIESMQQNFGQSRGRPENLLSLSEKSFRILKNKQLLPEDLTYENAGPVSFRIIDHQLLLNWCRISVNEIEKTELGLMVQFFAYNSPLVPRWPDGHVVIADHAPIGHSTMRKVRFTPDAVFALTNKSRDKSMLFFLEVDCGTETLASPQRDMSDLRQKILNYQWYFHSLKYKRYEQLFKVSHFQGFRLLFVSKTEGRLAALCKLTQEMPPSDFVWLTEQNRLFAKGIYWKIWARGGNLHQDQQSIIGRLGFRKA